MALTMTCSVSLANMGTAEKKQMLFAALGCNMAWGLVDAITYLLSLVVKQKRNKLVFDAVRRTSSLSEAQNEITEHLPPLVLAVLTADELEKIRSRVAQLPDETARVTLSGRDVARAVALFFLVFGSTFPLVLPFLLISDNMAALRTSNGVALLMMFFCGWSVAKYSGINRWAMSLGIVLLGVLLVSITIALGG